MKYLFRAKRREFFFAYPREARRKNFTYSREARRTFFDLALAFLVQGAADQIVTTGRPAPRAGLAFRRPTGDERAELEGLIRQHQRGKEVADAEEGGRRKEAGQH